MSTSAEGAGRMINFCLACHSRFRLPISTNSRRG